MILVSPLKGVYAVGFIVRYYIIYDLCHKVRNDSFIIKYKYELDNAQYGHFVMDI